MFDKTKQHVRNNKKVYITGGVCLAIGSAVTYTFLTRTPSQNVTVKQILPIKSPVTNNVVQVQQNIPRAGHAGKVFLDRETGEHHMSVMKLSKALNVTRSEIQKYLRGEVPDLAGRQFDLIMDGASPLTVTTSFAE